MVGLSPSCTPAMGPSPALAAKPLLALAWLLGLAPWATHLGRLKSYWSQAYEAGWGLGAG